MTIKQIVAIIGGLLIGAVATLVILGVARIPIGGYGAVNMGLTVLFLGLVGAIALDSLLKAGILS